MDSWEYYCPTRNHTYQSSFYVVKWTVFWIITGVINVSNSWVVLLQRRDTPFTLPFSSSLWLKPEHDFRLQGRRCWKAEECVGVAEYLNRRDIYHRHRPAILALNYWNSWRRQWHPTPVLLPGKSHGWRSLVGGSPWGRWGSDMTERLDFHFFTFMHWRRKWQPTPVFLPRESQGLGSLVGCRLWGCRESDTTEAT